MNVEFQRKYIYKFLIMVSVSYQTHFKNKSSIMLNSQFLIKYVAFFSLQLVHFFNEFKTWLQARFSETHTQDKILWKKERGRDTCSWPFLERTPPDKILGVIVDWRCLDVDDFGKVRRMKRSLHYFTIIHSR